jgi:hypothetical protein
MKIILNRIDVASALRMIQLTPPRKFPLDVLSIRHSGM